MLQKYAIRITYYVAMCGRFTQTKSRKEVLETIADLELPPLFLRRYNVAPTQKVAAISQASPDRADECIWGFPPPRSGAPVINARIETLSERPMFRGLTAGHRCLIPADGFFEWKAKQPYYFQLPNQSLFAFAGLRRNDHCVILTRAADAGMRGIHDRMPVILPPERWRDWLNSPRPADPPRLTCRPVSRAVNKTSNDSPDCLAQAEVQQDLSLFPNHESSTF